MSAPILKLRKDGKPHAASLQKYRYYVKENFAEISSFGGENLPPQLQGYYRQIAGAKKQAAERIHNPKTGRFFSNKQNEKIKKEIQSFAKDTGASYEQILKQPEKIQSVFNLIDRREIIKMLPSDIIIDTLKNYNVIKVNGNEVTAAQAALMIIKANKTAMNATGGFSPTNETTTDLLGTTINIFVPDFKGMSEEDILEEINSLESEGFYTLSKSDKTKAKERKKRNDTKAKGRKKRKGKK